MSYNSAITTMLLLLSTAAGCAISPHGNTVGTELVPLTRTSSPKSGIPIVPVSNSTADPFVMTERGGPMLDVEYGRRRPVIDGIGTVLGVPRKLLLWDRRADNHRVSDETVDNVANYLGERNLADVKVRVNQYAPIGEWRRLVANKQVGAGWRYTLGTLKHLEYTLLPGRIWGGDEYNPYTNSLYLYSDAAPLALAEAAYAKDIHERHHPGTYAAAQELPIIGLWHESLATDETMSYVTERSTAKDIAETRRLLYARYGMKAGGDIGGVGPSNGLSIGSFAEVIGAVSGHAIAGIENHRELQQREQTSETAPIIRRGNH